MDAQDLIRISQRLNDIEWNVQRLLKKEGMAWEAKPADASVPPEVYEALQAGNMILAIKRYREHTGLGLAEAKEAVERLQGTA